MKRTFVASGINWTWYLEAEISGDEMKVLSIYRLHYTEERVKSDGFYHPNEGKGRILESVAITDGSCLGSKTYKVSNPKHVFDYNGR